MIMRKIRNVWIDNFLKRKLIGSLNLKIREESNKIYKIIDLESQEGINIKSSLEKGTERVRRLLIVKCINKKMKEEEKDIICIVFVEDFCIVFRK